MKVFVIGIGLIGGSMVLDIKKCIRKRPFMESIQMRFIYREIALGVIDAAESMIDCRLTLLLYQSQ
jgi:prephenate dehydrogenase